VNVTGNAELPHGSRSFTQFFNTSVFAAPGLNDPGNSPRVVIRGPGVNLWDMSLSKHFPLKNEHRNLEFRGDLQYVQSHAVRRHQHVGAIQPGRPQVNAQFGQVTSTRLLRVMAGTLRCLLT
jgi:hypothetical protein